MTKTNPKLGLWQAIRYLDPITRSVTMGLLAISLGVVGWFGADWWSHNRTYRLVLAAGSSTGESYILAKAIEAVIEAKVPRVSIDVRETDGTADNLKQIEANKVDLATAQADVPAGGIARTIAILYSDSFQVVVQGKSTLRKFTDLKGKRIGLAQKGGQYASFLQVAQHFGLAEKDFTFIGDSDQSSDLAFQQGQVDAIFRVRAIGNAQIATLIRNHGGRLIAIEQTEAMRVKHPSFEPTKLPKGAYQGNEPTVPADDLPTVSVQRLLLANANLDPAIALQITQAINENRRELQAAIPPAFSNASPLVSNIRRPETTGGTGIPIHPGALSYYDRDEPSFMQKNAEYLGLILTLTLLGGSWLWQLTRWMDRRKKNLSDGYIEQVVNVMNACQAAAMTPQDALTKIDRIFEQVATELIQEAISQESFRTFMEAYKTVREVIDRKRF
jgi:TRAP transporter TAXI family solute receptor